MISRDKELKGNVANFFHQLIEIMIDLEIIVKTSPILPYTVRYKTIIFLAHQIYAEPILFQVKERLQIMVPVATIY